VRSVLLGGVGHVDQSAAVDTGSQPSSTTSSSSSSRRPQETRRPHAVLERSCKDLHRQTVSLERLRVVLGENVDKAFKRINEVFKELHQQSVISALSDHQSPF